MQARIVCKIANHVAKKRKEHHRDDEVNDDRVNWIRIRKALIVQRQSVQWQSKHSITVEENDKLVAMIQVIQTEQ